MANWWLEKSLYMDLAESAVRNILLSYVIWKNKYANNAMHWLWASWNLAPTWSPMVYTHVYMATGLGSFLKVFASLSSHESEYLSRGGGVTLCHPGTLIWTYRLCTEWIYWPILPIGITVPLAHVIEPHSGFNQPSSPQSAEFTSISRVHLNQPSSPQSAEFTSISRVPPHSIDRVPLQSAESHFSQSTEIVTLCIPVSPFPIYIFNTHV